MAHFDTIAKVRESSTERVPATADSTTAVGAGLALLFVAIVSSVACSAESDPAGDDAGTAGAAGKESSASGGSSASNSSTGNGGGLADAQGGNAGAVGADAAAEGASTGGAAADTSGSAGAAGSAGNCNCADVHCDTLAEHCQFMQLSDCPATLDELLDGGSVNWMQVGCGQRLVSRWEGTGAGYEYIFDAMTAALLAGRRYSDSGFGPCSDVSYTFGDPAIVQPYDLFRTGIVACDERIDCYIGPGSAAGASSLDPCMPGTGGTGGAG